MRTQRECAVRVYYFKFNKEREINKSDTWLYMSRVLLRRDNTIIITNFVNNKSNDNFAMGRFGLL